jgi:hypothetical protein
VRVKIEYHSKHFNVAMHEHFAIFLKREPFTWSVVDFRPSFIRPYDTELTQASLGGPEWVRAGIAIAYG